VFRALGDNDQALAHEAQARSHHAAHLQMQAEVKALLGGLKPD
jgi:hypothetical protein